MTHVPAKPQDKPGPSCHWRARQEHCTGVLTPPPLEDTSPDVKDSRPPLLLHPRNCPAPFSWLPWPSSCTQSASRPSQCQGTLNALTSVFSQTSPLHSKHLHPTWLPAALWSFTRAAGLTPTRPYFNNLHRPPSRPGAETSGR